MNEILTIYVWTLCVFDQLFVNTQDVGLIFRDCPDYHT